jgi:hypothetical protein
MWPEGNGSEFAMRQSAATSEFQAVSLSPSVAGGGGVTKTMDLCREMCCRWRRKCKPVLRNQEPQLYEQRGMRWGEHSTAGFPAGSMSRLEAPLAATFCEVARFSQGFAGVTTVGHTSLSPEEALCTFSFCRLCLLLLLLARFSCGTSSGSRRDNATR